MIHFHALVEPGADSGKRPRVRAFTHVPDGMNIGEHSSSSDRKFSKPGKVLAASSPPACADEPAFRATPHLPGS